VLAHSADGYYLTLPRNALAPAARNVSQLLDGEDLFGTTAPSGSARILRQDTTIVLRSRLPLADVCRHFIDRHRGAGVHTFENGGETPMCQLSREDGPPDAWNSISVLPDPQSEGAVMISIMRTASKAVPSEPKPFLDAPERAGRP
jgi:hypothetical protein